MSSGSGTGFQTWRTAWQDTLIEWVSRIEHAHLVRDKLSSLVALSAAQLTLLNDHVLDHKSLTQRLSEHLSVYLEGRGALTQQLVFLLNPRFNIQWPQIANALYSQLALHSDQTSESAIHCPLLVAHSSTPHISFVQFFTELYTVTELRSYPLLARLFYGEPLSNIYRSTPPLSLKLWLIRELTLLIGQHKTLPSVVIITQADQLDERELELWAVLMDEYRSLGQPLALILMPTQTEITEGAQQLQPFHRRALLCEEFDDVHMIGKGSKFGARLTEWDRQWTLGLLGHQELSLNDESMPMVDEQLWAEALFNLSPEYQAHLLYCLSPLKALFKVNGLDERVVDATIIKRLIQAGWLRETNGGIFSTTHLLNMQIFELFTSPQRLARNVPQAVKILIKMLQVSDSDLDFSTMGLEEKGLLGLYSDSLKDWIGLLSYEIDEDIEHKPKKFIKDGYYSILDEFSLHSMNMPIVEHIKDQGDQSVLERYLSDGVQHLFRYHQDLSVEDVLNRAQRLEEVASTLGDLRQLSALYFLQAMVDIKRDDLKQAIPRLATAHQLSCQLGQDEVAFECRSAFIMLLVQSGHVEFAQQLLNTEYKTLEVHPQLSDDLNFMLGIVAAHRRDWTLALTHFSSIAQKNAASLVWEALATLKSSALLLDSDSEAQFSNRQKQVAEHAKSLLSKADRLEAQSFDLEALATWLSTIIMVILKEPHNVLASYEQWATLAQQPIPLTRGHYYCAWTLKLLNQYRIELNLPFNHDEEERLKKQSQELTLIWRDGHQMLSTYLVENIQQVKRLLSPHTHISQRRSILRFPLNRSHLNDELWELGEDGFMGLLSHLSNVDDQSDIDDTVDPI